MKKLFLLDAMALIYRAHFAFQKTPRISSKGLNTSAVFGFANTLLEILAKEKPTHLGVAFDTPTPTFRHVQFEAYKAQRQEQPEDITVAIPYVKRLLEAMNIPILLMEGYEADDVIGTLVKKAVREHEDMEIYMMTPDKDYGQLVEERIKMYKPAFMGKGVEILGPQEVCDKWGIESVSQVIDILGLMGDAVDNIPGIPGIGEKTAQKLIAEFGSVENLIANADKLKGKQKENVVNFAQQGLLSKELATILCEVPIEFHEESLRLSEVNKEALSPLLDELEFRTLRKRLLGEESEPVTKEETVSAKASKAAAAGQMDLFGGLVSEKPLAVTETTLESKQNIFSTIHQYHAVDTPELRQNLVHFLSLQEAICFDTETTSVDAVEAELVGLAFAYRKGEAFYVPVPADQAQAQAIVDEFRPVLENENIEKIAQNIKYDLMVLQRYGLTVKGKLYDTMLAHYLIEPEKRHNMDILAEDYLNYTPVSIEELIGKKGAKQGNMRDVELEKIKEYAAEDADITLQLKERLHPILAENAGAVKLFEEVEMPLTQVLADIEMEGVRIDTEFLGNMSKELETDMRIVQDRVFELAGVEFNIGSPKQLGEILFEKLKLDPKAKKTKTGQYMTGEEILSKLESEHEIAKKILDFRELQKLKSTYVDALPQLVSPTTGRIHTSFNQAVAVTGRLSSTNPNLQNIPIRTPRGREIRKAFIPRNEEFLILSADYSQIELRIMAAFAQDESMIEAFNQGRDIHATTAAKVFNVSLDEVTSDMRRKAKTVNFGIIYGVSAFGLSQQIAISRSEAKEIIDSYWREFPAIKQYMDSAVIKARDTGYCETILGRRRYLRDINAQNMVERGFAERNAINAPIQGSAADMIKVAMIKVNDFIKKEKLRSRMILTVHDELVFDAHRDELDLLKERVNDLMIHAIDFPVKMETGMGVGQNWLEAH
ncbi:DNA polymerase I [Flectobacillus sp. DC10W]|uniref:DNA polymerase I n=1 Tax=Flectobacillus longus TaxID=2984207 RepID=A0ABT6YTF5_9BACT|nr:DNA polymerase I [Flectobacillus longus]MDI9866856.1 DNA polymerase I [Flectobacillus longus]